jgi:hypothetical protein
VRGCLTAGLPYPLRPSRDAQVTESAGIWLPRQGKLKANETADRTGTIHPAGVSAPVFASGRKRLTMARSSFELNGLER